jgi:hypothetical protein
MYRLNCFTRFTDFINLLKAKRVLNNIYGFSSYLTGNILRLRYKVQPVNAV